MQEFTGEEVAAGVRYSYEKHGFQVDADYLRRAGNRVLEKLEGTPKPGFRDAVREVLSEVRSFSERLAYVDAVGKMCNGRSAVVRSRKAQQKKKK